ncbi:helix-turn-helix domain-containing protein [Citricoccus sp. K5]|uniref:helix-turn-helix domain-containing protein n=1 Tax=Citricoccus sp. K5 TaxID=2653135 RepID=UPI001358857E|nr:helix-turn-helix transcriptional regulator [Citricoccus sp. K5]
MAHNARPNLGEFLRHRRALMKPPGQQERSRLSARRVPGLRRHELSDIAGISSEYYTRLEQGRALRPSREILSALGAALQLSTIEAEHLFRLAGELPPEPLAPSTTISPGVRQLLASLEGSTPVTVHDGRLDMLSINATATELFAPLFDDGPYGRNIVHQAFTAKGLSTVLGCTGARQLRLLAAAEFRRALSRYPEDERLQGLLNELLGRGSEFADIWALGEVGTRRTAMKNVHHPTKGALSFESQMLHDPERDHWVMLFAPVRS